MQLGNLGRKQTFCEAMVFGREEQGCGAGKEREGEGSAPLHHCPDHPDSDKRHCGHWAAPWESFRERNPDLEVLADTPWAELPGPGRQTPSPISCPLFSTPLAQELHQKKEKTSPWLNVKVRPIARRQGQPQGRLPRPQRAGKPLGSGKQEAPK